MTVPYNHIGHQHHPCAYKQKCPMVIGNTATVYPLIHGKLSYLAKWVPFHGYKLLIEITEWLYIKIRHLKTNMQQLSYLDSTAPQNFDLITISMPIVKRYKLSISR